MPGIWELLIVLVIILVIFGAGKLTQIGGQLGSAIHMFKKSSTATDTEQNSAPVDAVEQLDRQDRPAE